MKIDVLNFYLMFIADDLEWKMFCNKCMVDYTNHTEIMGGITANEGNGFARGDVP